MLAPFIHPIVHTGKKIWHGCCPMWHAQWCTASLQPVSGWAPHGGRCKSRLQRVGWIATVHCSSRLRGPGRNDSNCGQFVQQQQHLSGLLATSSPPSPSSGCMPGPAGGALARPQSRPCSSLRVVALAVLACSGPRPRMCTRGGQLHN